MKWLFGVSTTEELNIVSEQIANIQENEKFLGDMAQRQATLTNASLWEIRNMDSRMKEISRTTKELNNTYRMKQKYSIRT